MREVQRMELLNPSIHKWVSHKCETENCEGRATGTLITMTPEGMKEKDLCVECFQKTREVKP